MSIQIIKIAGIIIGGTIGGYLSGKFGEYFYGDNKKKIPQIDTNKEIKQIPINSSKDEKITTFEELINREIKNQNNPNNNDYDEISDYNLMCDIYNKEYLNILKKENKKIQKEKEILFINDAIYDNDYYDYILLVAK